MKNPRIEALARIQTPLGPLVLAATPQGLAGAWFDDQRHHPGEIPAPFKPQHPVLQQAAAAMQAYWNGGPQAFTLPLDAEGTAFQQAVWRALCEIAPGDTCSYADIARRIGNPAAVRAVGAAVGRNPLGIIVPCHRVVGSDGSLTGYAGGLHRKQALLQHESGQAALAA
ncbi:MAG: methylated-DNA--[protein]-cysteine S-methyltransferase [Rubrivivax sp.]